MKTTCGCLQRGNDKRFINNEKTPTVSSFESGTRELQTEIRS